MPSLVRTPDRHSTPGSRTPALKPFSEPDLHVAGVQEHAATPSRESVLILSLITLGVFFVKNLCLNVIVHLRKTRQKQYNYLKKID